MSPEEYERIKEAEKAHLRKLRDLKRAVRRLEQRRSAQQALGRVIEGAENSLARHEEAVRRLAEETAREEARLELALEEADLDETPDLAELDAQLQHVRARDLVQRVRQDLDDPASDDAETEVSATRPEATDDTSDLPEKTLGRMRPRTDTP